MSLTNWILLCVLSTLWGSSFIFIEVALPVFTPFMIVFLRSCIGVLILFSFMKLRGGAFPKGIKVWFEYGVMAALIVAIPYSLISWAQLYVTASIASILNAMTPIFTVIVAHFATKDERLTVLKILGTIAGFIGVALLMDPNMENTDRGPDGGAEGAYQWLSQVAVLFATFCYALANVWGKRLSKYKAEVNSTAVLLMASFMLAVPAALTSDIAFNDLKLMPILAMISLGVLSTGLAYILYFKILAEAGATNITLVTFLIPVSAVILAIIFLGETLAVHHIYAVICIAFGLVCIDGRLLRKVF
jgi:drug/metabolite transporter (DMT)-like permease